MSQPAPVLLRASSIAPAARTWVEASRSARVLHAFHRSCNLINEHGRILSLVGQEIGDGPFNAVLPALEGTLRGRVDASSPVELGCGSLRLDWLAVDLDSASSWQPRPDWKSLHEARALVRRRVSALRPKGIPVAAARGEDQPTGSPRLHQQADEAVLCAAGDLSAAVNSLDRSAASSAAARLAGLGEGLTPSGDDVLMGTIHAAWIIHEPGQASRIASAIMAAARSRTTALSLAWLEAAVRGEAAIRWHRLLDALLLGDTPRIEACAASILATGHTSGRAALHGFLYTLLNFRP